MLTQLCDSEMWLENKKPIYVPHENIAWIICKKNQENYIYI